MKTAYIYNIYNQMQKSTSATATVVREKQMCYETEFDEEFCDVVRFRCLKMWFVQ